MRLGGRAAHREESKIKCRAFGKIVQHVLRWRKEKGKRRSRGADRKSMSQVEHPKDGEEWTGAFGVLRQPAKEKLESALHLDAGRFKNRRSSTRWSPLGV